METEQPEPEGALPSFPELKALDHELPTYFETYENEAAIRRMQLGRVAQDQVLQVTES
jgi:hypothetical protein